MFSALNETFASEVEFTDPYAYQNSVHCGIVPRNSAIDSFSLIWWQPSTSTRRSIAVGVISYEIIGLATIETFNLSQLGFNAHYGYQLSDSIMWSTYASESRQAANGDFLFGGPKLSRNAPPTIQSTLHSSPKPVQLGSRMLLLTGTQ